MPLQRLTSITLIDQTPAPLCWRVLLFQTPGRLTAGNRPHLLVRQTELAPNEPGIQVLLFRSEQGRPRETDSLVRFPSNMALD